MGSDQPPHLGGRRRRRAAGRRDRGNFPERRQRRADTPAVVTALAEVANGVTRTRSSAATVLAASDEVEKAAARLRSEVEEFLGTVAA